MEGRRERGQEEGKVCGGTGEMGPWVKCLDFDPQHSHQNPGGHLLSQQGSGGCRLHYQAELSNCGFSKILCLKINKNK